MHCNDNCTALGALCALCSMGSGCRRAILSEFSCAAQIFLSRCMTSSTRKASRRVPTSRPRATIELASTAEREGVQLRGGWQGASDAAMGCSGYEVSNRSSMPSPAGPYNSACATKLVRVCAFPHSPLSPLLTADGTRVEPCTATPSSV